MLRGTKMKPRPRPWMTPLSTSIEFGDVEAEAGSSARASSAVSSRPARISRRVSTFPIIRPTSIIEIIVPTPRGASTRAGGDDRIAYQMLQEGRQQRHGRQQDDADHEDEARGR